MNIIRKIFHQKHVLSLKIIVHLMSLLPISWTFYLAVADDLGGDPVEALLHFTGIGALNLLLVTLILTPLAKKSRTANLIKFRRLLGLYSFFYACVHLAVFVAFELQFEMSLVVAEIIERPYITVGMLAFMILSLLAITSIHAIKLKMGRHWQSLHNFVYLGVLLVTLHFIWSVKSDLIEPLIYLVLVITLLALRKNKIKTLLKK